MILIADSDPAVRIIQRLTDQYCYFARPVVPETGVLAAPTLAPPPEIVKPLTKFTPLISLVTVRGLVE